MSGHYFSDRELGPRPRTNENVGLAAWKGIYAVVNSHVEDGSFGHKYPLQCPDGRGPYGCDRNAFAHAVEGEVGIPWPTYPSEDSLPTTPLILDLIEFSHRVAARPGAERLSRLLRARMIAFPKISMSRSSSA
jgi:hypothetical protein